MRAVREELFYCTGQAKSYVPCAPPLSSYTQRTVPCVSILCIRFYLNEWRNQLIRENNLGGMDGVTEVMLKFT